MSAPPRRVAVVGAGMAGSRCAQALAAAGCEVQVFDKARGPGGRLATRRHSWHGQTLGLDHGAPGFSGPHPAFEEGFVNPGLQAGWLQAWTPRRPDGSRGLPQWRVASPQPQACRALLGDLPLHTQHTLAALSREQGAWTLHWAEPEHPPQAGFDAVLLALPPAQAAALLSPVDAETARAAALVPMQPCWTLMLLTEPLNDGPAAWDELLPAGGPLARVLRQEGRQPGVSPDVGCWVLHARPAWSREQLEAEPAQVLALLQAAWAEALQGLGHALPAVHQASVHRWRYAEPVLALPTRRVWWDARSGLGLCGDWLAPGGVQGAWLSGNALAAAVMGASAEALSAPGS